MSDMMGHFALIGETFDPSYVTQKLGIEPSDVRLKGGVSKGGHIFDCTVWGIDTKTFTNATFSDVLDVLLSKINCSSRALRDVAEACNAQWRVIFYIGIREYTPISLHFSPEQVKFLAEAKAEIDYDTYVYL